MRFNKLLLILPVMMFGFTVTDVMAASCVPDPSIGSGKDNYLFGSGFSGGLECDTQKCISGTKVTVREPRVGKKTVTDISAAQDLWASFQCIVQGGLSNTYWERITLPDCKDDIHSRLKKDNNAVREPYNPDTQGQSKNNWESHAVIGNRVCLAWVCMEGYDEVVGADGTTAQCVAKGKGTNTSVVPTPNPTPKPNPNPTPNPVVSDCMQRPTALGITCCKAGKATRYFGPKTKSELDRGVNMPESCICLDAAGKDDATKEFDMASLSCVAKGTPEQPVQPVQPVNPCGTMCETYVDITIDSNNCNTQRTNLQSIKTQVQQQCEQDTKCDAKIVSKLVTQMRQLVVECNAKPKLNEKRLTDAITALDKYRSGLDVSVWKDEQGNFNTARLASDSIAGVVLGTTGALITSSIVKKNQIKSGFEDIVCTIGGHIVGSYGDEISAEIR